MFPFNITVARAVVSLVSEETSPHMSTSLIFLNLFSWINIISRAVLFPYINSEERGGERRRKRPMASFHLCWMVANAQSLGSWGKLLNIVLLGSKTLTFGF